MSKYLEKMCLDTKFQPFRFRNDKDIDVQIDVPTDPASTAITGI